MEEGTIFSQQPLQNPASSTPLPQQQPLPGKSFFSKFSPKTLIKIGLLAFLIIVILFVIFALIFPRFNKEENRNVSLSYWGFWEEGSLNSVISDFEKENPNIKINYSRQDQEDYRERLVTRIQNGDGPDIFRFHNSWYPMLRDFLLPLPKGTIEKKEFLDNFYDVAATDLIKNGAIYGIPLEIDTLALYINPQIFESTVVPTTWQEFVEAAQALTKRNEDGLIDVAGAAMGTYENVAHAPDIISLLFAQNGANMQDLSSSPAKVEDALRFYTNFALVERSVWDQTLPNSTLAFSQGKLAMYFGYSWDYFTIKEKNPQLIFKIVSAPQLLKDEKVNIASYFAEGVSSKSKHPKEALLFMKYLAKPEAQEKLYQEVSKAKVFGQPYGNKTLADKLKDSKVFIFVDQARTAVSSPFVDLTYNNGLNDRLNNYLKDSVNSILNNSSEKGAAETLLKGYSQILKEYEPKKTN